jgi:hypothetical protein
MKKFDLEKAKAGAPVCTRDGKPVRIICWDAKDPNYPIVALVDNFDTETAETYTDDGFWQKDKTDNELNLMMATVKHEGYVLIVKARYSPHILLRNARSDFSAHCRIFPSERAAREAADAEKYTYEAIAHIEWEE